MRLLGAVLSPLLFFYENISHATKVPKAQKAPKAPKAQKAQKAKKKHKN